MDCSPAFWTCIFTDAWIASKHPKLTNSKPNLNFSLSPTSSSPNLSHLRVWQIHFSVTRVENLSHLWFLSVAAHIQAVVVPCHSHLQIFPLSEGFSPSTAASLNWVPPFPDSIIAVASELLCFHSCCSTDYSWLSFQGDPFNAEVGSYLSPTQNSMASCFTLVINSEPDCDPMTLQNQTSSSSHCPHCHSVLLLLPSTTSFQPT